MLRPGEGGRDAGFVMILKEAGQLVLEVEAGTKVVSDRAGVASEQPVVKALVVAVREALLLQGPFEVPVDFGHEGEVGVFLVNGLRRLRPEGFSGCQAGLNNR